MKDNKYFPQKIFRYRRCDTDYFLDELDNAINFQRVFLCSARNVNDPFEFAPAYEESPTEEVLRLLKKRFGNKPIVSREIFESFHGRRFSRQQYRKHARHFKTSNELAKLLKQHALNSVNEQQKMECLACFSETDQSIPMWAHYTDSHKGICLEFRLRPEDHSEDYPLPNKVIYSPIRPKITTRDILAFMNMAELPDREHRSNKTFDALHLKKADEWSYEKEWRVSARLGGQSQYIKIPSISVSSIKFGVRADEEKIAEVLSRFGHRVPVYRAELSKQNFDVHFKRLN